MDFSSTLSERMETWFGAGRDLGSVAYARESRLIRDRLLQSPAGEGW